MTESRYRPGVGIALFNCEGRVFIGKRRPRAPDHEVLPGYAWQMPQGGIDLGETPLQAAVRELREETGVSHVSRLSELDEWLRYDLPETYARSSFGGKYAGQRQKWFAFRFEGQDREVDLAPADVPGQPEFEDWRWAELEELPQLVVPFKRQVYERIVEAFSGFARGLRSDQHQAGPRSQDI